MERVVLLGAPISINNENWRDVRKVILDLRILANKYVVFLSLLCLLFGYLRWWPEDSSTFTPQMIGHSGLLSVQGTYLPSFVNFVLQFHLKIQFFFSFLNFRSLLAQGLAGIQPVCIPGIEDVHLILSPFVYIFSVHVNLNDINIRFITIIFIVTYLIPLTLQVDVTDMVEGHSSYLWKTQQILERLELDNSYPVFRNTL